MPWKTSYPNVLNLSLFISCSFKVTMVVFGYVFEEYYIFCDNDGPLSNVRFSALYFYNSLLNNRLKSKEMTACFQNFRFYRSIILNYSSEVKCKLITNLSKNIIITFLLMTYVEKTSYFEVAPPGHTIAYNNVDYLLKHGKFKL